MPQRTTLMPVLKPLLGLILIQQSAMLGLNLLSRSKLLRQDFKAREDEHLACAAVEEVGDDGTAEGDFWCLREGRVFIEIMVVGVGGGGGGGGRWEGRGSVDAEDNHVCKV